MIALFKGLAGLQRAGLHGQPALRCWTGGRTRQIHSALNSPVPVQYVLDAVRDAVLLSLVIIASPVHLDWLVPRPFQGFACPVDVHTRQPYPRTSSMHTSTEPRQNLSSLQQRPGQTTPIQSLDALCRFIRDLLQFQATSYPLRSSGPLLQLGVHNSA